MNKQRLEAERLIYKIMDTIDPSETNKQYWMEQFADMTDAQFKTYISRPMWAFFQTGAFHKEPSMDNIRKALKELRVPLIESVYMPYKYKDKDGNPVKTKPCLVIYLNVKRLKQMLTKKNKISTDNSIRDMKTGQLTGVSKGGRESDREVESLMISSLDDTAKELLRARADAMEDKEIMNNTIKNLGQVYLKDLPADPTDELGKNNLSESFIGAQLYTNLVINSDYMTPYTLKNKQKKINRVD